MAAAAAGKIQRFFTGSGVGVGILSFGWCYLSSTPKGLQTVQHVSEGQRANLELTPLISIRLQIPLTVTLLLQYNIVYMHIYTVYINTYTPSPSRHCYRALQCSIIQPHCTVTVKCKIVLHGYYIILDQQNTECNTVQCSTRAVQ